MQLTKFVKKIPSWKDKLDFSKMSKDSDICEQTTLPWLASYLSLP